MQVNEENPHRSRRPGSLENLTIAHAAGLLIFTAWTFGGETDFANAVIRWWGVGAIPIAVFACLRRLRRREGLPPALGWLWPLLLFDALALASCLNPSFTRMVIGGADAYVLNRPFSFWPGSAQPGLSLRELWLFNAIYLTCFNLAVAVKRRRALRVLLLIAAANALLLAIFGVFQKLAGAPGLFFGLRPSPNPAFFASFIYHNHWGAFGVPAAAAALGLFFHHARRDDYRRSPALFGGVSALFIAASVPLSTSRSCSVLMLVLLTGALFYWLRVLYRRSRRGDGSLAMPAVFSTGIFLVGLTAILLLGRPVIEARLEKTRTQIDELRLRGDLGARQQLYADTWRMIRARPWFGWGLGSYAMVFRLYNTQKHVEPWFGQPFYAEAHSDWLQSLAEVGAVGTALLLLTGLVPLLAMRRRRAHGGPIPSWLFAGCGLLVLYAWVEFPFANPAVMLAFWLCFFTAVRYQRLSGNDI